MARTKSPRTEDDAPQVSSSQQVPVVTYVEFYSGIGGWTMALHEALDRMTAANDNRPPFRLERLAALDHSDLCQTVFHHNFSQQETNTKKRRRVEKTAAVEKLTVAQAEEWNAVVWAMSPPCQPHTRQHDKQKEDLLDPRSKSFLNICNLLQHMSDDKLPRVLMMENVVGFESSGSCQRWREVLKQRNYVVGHFHLSPTQVGIPNDRPRYYCVAVRSNFLTQRNGLSVKDVLRDETDIADSVPFIQTTNDSLGVQPEPTEMEMKTNHQINLPRISEFLDTEANSSEVSLAIPDKILNSSAAWCFDIVTPQDQRSACFTHAYGKFVRGTGSVLYNGPLQLETGKEKPDSGDTNEDIRDRFQLISPEERKYNPQWSKGLDLKRHLRYFSGTEIARLMGFPVATKSCSSGSSLSFSFPDSSSAKQQWKLLGNSLNVRVAARIAELGLVAVNYSTFNGQSSCE